MNHPHNYHPRLRPSGLMPFRSRGDAQRMAAGIATGCRMVNHALMEAHVTGWEGIQALVAVRHRVLSIVCSAHDVTSELQWLVTGSTTTDKFDMKNPDTPKIGAILLNKRQHEQAAEGLLSNHRMELVE